MVKKIFLLSIGAALCAFCVNAAEQPIKPTILVAWDLTSGEMVPRELMHFTDFDIIVSLSVQQLFNLIHKPLADVSPADLKGAHYLIIVQSPSRTEALRDVVAKIERSVEAKKLANFKNKAYVLIRQDPNSINIEPRISSLFGGNIFQLYWKGYGIIRNTDSYTRLEEFLQKLSFPQQLEKTINEFYLKLQKQDIGLTDEYLYIIGHVRNIFNRLISHRHEEIGIIPPEIQQRIKDYIGDLKMSDKSEKLAKQFSSIIEQLKEQIAKLKKR